MAKRVIRFLIKAMKVIFIVFLLCVLSLFFHETRLPRALVARLESEVSSETVVVHADNVFFCLRSGLRIEGVKVHDLGRKDRMTSMFSASSVELALWSRCIRLAEARFPRLGDSYYDPNWKVDVDAPPALRGVRFPALGAFDLEMLDSDILGIASRKITARLVIEPERLELRGIRLDWPDREWPMGVDGFLRLDLAAMRLDGEVRGTAVQRNIRPLLVALDIPVSLPYFDGFTEVRGPVRAGCTWDVNLETSEFTIGVDIDPDMGRYNGIPFSRATGRVGVHCYFTREGLNYDTTIGPITAYDTAGRLLDGKFTVHGTNGICRLEFNDVRTELPLDDFLRVADVFRDGTIGAFVSETPPRASLAGFFSPDARLIGANALTGSVSTARASFMGVPVRDARFGIRMEGPRLSFDDIAATGTCGGSVAASATIDVPGYRSDEARFGAELAWRNGSLREIEKVFSFDIGDTEGVVSADFSVEGPLSSNAVSRLKARGRFSTTGSDPSKATLLKGLFAQIVDKVPGIVGVSGDSTVTADFSMENGIARTDNLVIRGQVLTIFANGTYDAVRDNLDFTVRTQVLKDGSLLAKPVHVMLWPFSKLLMEFRLTGPVGQPVWRYISILDRVMDITK